MQRKDASSSLSIAENQTKILKIIMTKTKAILVVKAETPSDNL